MTALFRKSLYFITLILATFFVIKYLPTFAQQSPKFSDFYPPTAIPTVTKTPTPKKTPSATPTFTTNIPTPTYLPGIPSPTSLPPGFPTFTPTISKKPTKTPTPKPTKAPVSDVIDLVNKIKGACKNSLVTGDTLSCLDNINPPLPSGVKSRLVASTISNFYLQCVGFVRASTVLLYGADFSNRGNAIDFASNVPPGYQFFDKYSVKIKVNDIPIWDVGVYGHIAVVVQVYSNNYFQIAEANWGTSGSVQLRNISLSDPDLKGFLRKI